ncbi:hypothetical protein [uncultured Thermomonospora sp.]|uniref:hypothetical protein n=1 Tax=uncultured Thermomonospora sp. TaxID=671175 RepID=UPI00338FB038
MKVWEAGTGWLFAACTEYGRLIWLVAFSPNGTVLATASDDSTAKPRRVAN